MGLEMDKALEVLQLTSRTFFIPITRLPDGLKEAVTSAYLAMRAIDEIEDHPDLNKEIKIQLLRGVSLILREPFHADDIRRLFEPWSSILPEVTLLLPEWLELCPEALHIEVYRATAVMADGMAKWCDRHWDIRDVADLNEYTFYVAGLVGLLLNEIWKWHDGTQCDTNLAVAFGRGLQTVNIIRNRGEDLAREVDYLPEGWKMDDLYDYARKQLELADQYIKSIQTREIWEFCRIPYVLALGTLRAMELGNQKLTREAVVELVESALASSK
ncbi:squalene/phytoene synthase family protein [Thermoactinomyces sp. DSM 45892]|uniref:squalene/phytoene synthase family protein n=1 Tax=Thermoactinomyces sp. DSM 45892 TaxID=1882753 RepID=UPI0008965F76|nr:phytoene/squalene synthase family protein [Thermoactinomyces sp. DSM 45892]SDY76800.1 farnesyl-diphosphate farnesyltransferase [Thermoactinomyces sp. DSM 45892]